MAKITQAAALALAAQIRDETGYRANTASRVGGLAYDVIESSWSGAMSPGTELTIAAGSITPTGNYHQVDTEANAATDYLDTIFDPGFASGTLLLLRSAYDGRDVTIRHDAANIFTSNGEDIILSDTREAVLLVKTDSGVWWALTTIAPGGFYRLDGSSPILAAFNADGQDIGTPAAPAGTVHTGRVYSGSAGLRVTDASGNVTSLHVAETVL